jgi:hypothetical protein
LFEVSLTIVGTQLDNYFFLKNELEHKVGVLPPFIQILLVNKYNFIKKMFCHKFHYAKTWFS